LKDKRYGKIILFNRSFQKIEHPNIEQIVADFSALNQMATQLLADEYFCCLGTTIKKARTKKAFEYVDYQLPLNIAKLAKENKVPKLLIVSSIGASAKSSTFYLKVKGQMEEEIGKIGIESLSFFRPSMLLGARKESRMGEAIGKVVMKMFGFLLFGKLKKYRAIEAEIVAKAMVVVANGSFSKSIFESDEIQEIGINVE